MPYFIKMKTRKFEHYNLSDSYEGCCQISFKSAENISYLQRKFESIKSEKMIHFIQFRPFTLLAGGSKLKGESCFSVSDCKSVQLLVTRNMTRVKLAMAQVNCQFDSHDKWDVADKCQRHEVMDRDRFLEWNESDSTVYFLYKVIAQYLKICKFDARVSFI